MGSGSPSSYMRAKRAASATCSAHSASDSLTSGRASQARISTVPNDWWGRIVHQISVCSRIEPTSIRYRTNPSYSAQLANASGSPQRGNMRVKICDRVERRYVTRSSSHGELAEAAVSSGTTDAEGVTDRHRAVSVADADVDVDAERVVAPRDVLELPLDDRVVRRVDDLLVLPAGERVRAVRAQADPELVGKAEQQATTLADLRGGLRERLAAPRLDLDLGLDQLAGDAAGQRRGVGQRPQLRVALSERQGVGIEDLELLLDADREVGRRGEMRTCLLERVERISFDGLAHGRAGR